VEINCKETEPSRESIYSCRERCSAHTSYFLVALRVCVDGVSEAALLDIACLRLGKPALSNALELVRQLKLIYRCVV
jgi:hypothetical protein